MDLEATRTFTEGTGGVSMTGSGGMYGSSGGSFRASIQQYGSAGGGGTSSRAAIQDEYRGYALGVQVLSFLTQVGVSWTLIGRMSFVLDKSFPALLAACFLMASSVAGFWQVVHFVTGFCAPHLMRTRHDDDPKGLFSITFFVFLIFQLVGCVLVWSQWDMWMTHEVLGTKGEVVALGSSIVLAIWLVLILLSFFVRIPGLSSEWVRWAETRKGTPKQPLIMH